MLEPLKQFICDTCGEVINRPEEGWIEWISKYDSETKKREIHSFNIVHHYSASPISEPGNEGCYQHSNMLGRSDSHLNQFLSDDYKMAQILSFLDIGQYHRPKFSGIEITDIRQYVETVRRLTIPYYEEARIHWTKALDDGYFEGANELWVYGVENLKELISRYKPA